MDTRPTSAWEKSEALSSQREGHALDLTTASNQIVDSESTKYILKLNNIKQNETKFEDFKFERPTLGSITALYEIIEACVSSRITAAFLRREGRRVMLQRLRTEKGMTREMAILEKPSALCARSMSSDVIVTWGSEEIFDAGDTLSQLTGEMKGASQNFEDDALTFNDLFARGSPPGQSFVRLATQPNKYVESLVQGLLLFPLMGLIVQPLNTRAAQSAVDKLGRTVVTGRSFGTTLCRDIVHIQALDKQLTQKDWLPIVNSTTQALPRSLPHLIRFFDEQLESVRDLVTLQGGFKDSGMLSLIENSASLFISNMGEAAAKLLDGIKSPCMSVDGQWRGLLLLFWHQYSQSFSTKRKDFHSIFYPEMLNDNFEENRALLFTDYNWQTQLTCEVGNAMRLTCWNCNGTSDVPFQCCQSTECKKKRVEEENLNIYLGKGGG